MNDDPWGGPPADLDDTEFWAEQRAEATGGSAYPPRRPAHTTTPWFQQVRAQANTVICRDCKRDVGQTCIDTGAHPVRELVHFPAHTRRIRDSGQAT